MARQMMERNLPNHPILQSISAVLWARGNARDKIIFTAVLIILAPVLIFTARKPSKTATDSGTAQFGVLSGNLEYINETQVVWQLPSSSAFASPKAVLFLAHGCHGRAAFFWDKSISCAECLGLPEERSIVMHALIKGYAVIAISSTRECWSVSIDKVKVMGIVSGWIKGKGLEGLPIVALGASSGGFFVSALAREYELLDAIVIMISEGVFHKAAIGSHYPPTLFVHMFRDKRRAALINSAMAMLRSRGVDTAEIKCYPLRVEPEYFTKIPGLDSRTSQQIHKVFKEIGVLNDDDFMTLDGRSMDWKMPLKARQVLPDAHYRLWDMHMRELLNLAYAYHEMTSIHTNEIFEWLNSRKPRSGV